MLRNHAFCFSQHPRALGWRLSRAEFRHNAAVGWEIVALLGHRYIPDRTPKLRVFTEGALWDPPQTPGPLGEL